MSRVWDQFLTDQDKQHLANFPKRQGGFGDRAALLLIDNYRGVVGDDREPLLESIQKWPMSTGLTGWEALDQIARLLAVARSAALPIVHVGVSPPERSGLPVGTSWTAIRDRVGERDSMSPEALERHARRYDVVEQAAPIAGEAVIEKTAASAFFGTPLAGHLNLLGVDTVIVVGETTSGCVRATVVDAASYRYRVVIPEQCVYDRHEACHAINLFDMDQKYADVLPLATVVEWIEGQSHR